MKVAESVYSISWILLTVAVYDYPLCGPFQLVVGGHEERSSWHSKPSTSPRSKTVSNLCWPCWFSTRLASKNNFQPQLWAETNLRGGSRDFLSSSAVPCSSTHSRQYGADHGLRTVAVPLFDPLWLQNDSKCMSRFLPSKLDSNQRPTTNLSCNLQFTVAPGRWE